MFVHRSQFADRSLRLLRACLAACHPHRSPLNLTVIQSENAFFVIDKLRTKADACFITGSGSARRRWLRDRLRSRLKGRRSATCRVTISILTDPITIVT